jgi:hypothetical protein
MEKFKALDKLEMTNLLLAIIDKAATTTSNVHWPI